MSKRSTRFYRKNEAEVMKRIGLIPTANSGSGWIQKEDGESEHFLCQLKSTDKESISMRQMDIRALRNHAAEAHKIPVFALQFLSSDEVWVAVRESDLQEIKDILSGKEKEEKEEKTVEQPGEKVYNNADWEKAEKSRMAREAYRKGRSLNWEKEQKERREKQREIQRERRRRNK